VTNPDASDVEAALDLHPDPVTEGDAYRNMLLGLLGDRDPAEVQGGTPDQVAAVVEEAGPNLRTRPAPGEWSVVELLGHIMDAEIVLAGRYRWILAHDEPPILPYDQDLWVQRLHHQDDDPEDMLALLMALRSSHLALWARTPQSERDRVGHHAERGPESFDLMFRMLAGHDLFHLGQMRRTLAQVKG
jgi:DinB family protein